jgi:nitrite reductase/ring-hydroxylating ferredoxin subunit
LRRHFARLEQDGASPPPAEAAAPMTEDGYYEVALESAVPDGSGLSVKAAGRELAVFRIDGQIRALDALGPHAGGSLAEGSIAGGAVVCPLHQWRFDAATGAGLAPATACVNSYPVRVDAGKVFVKLSERGA